MFSRVTGVPGVSLTSVEASMMMDNVTRVSLSWSVEKFRSGTKPQSLQVHRGATLRS